jgi:hypothetical protein
MWDILFCFKTPLDKNFGVARKKPWGCQIQEYVGTSFKIGLIRRFKKNAWVARVSHLITWVRSCGMGSATTKPKLKKSNIKMVIEINSK